LNGQLNSRYGCRNFFFEMRKKMLLNDMRNFTITLTVGFFVNVNFMISIGIIYEKMENELMSYNASVLPLIVFAVLLVAAIVGTLVFLLLDLLDKGCLAWHRDSLGILLQKLIFAVCLLFTFVYLYSYVKIIENNDFQISQSQNTRNIVNCFVPLLIFIFLLCFKMILFKVKYLLIWILVAVSIIGMPVVLYIKFDE